MDSLQPVKARVEIRTIKGVDVPERVDGYWGLKALGRSVRRNPDEYLRELSTKRFLLTAIEKTGLPENKLIETPKGTRAGAMLYDMELWAHPNIALHFAAWCNAGIEWEVYDYVVKHSSFRGEVINVPSLIMPELQGVLVTLGQHMNTLAIQVTYQSQEIISIRQDVEALKVQQSLGTGYITILGFARKTRQPISQPEANILGRRATKICEVRGIEIGHVSDERWGIVNSYPETILEEIWPKN